MAAPVQNMGTMRGVAVWFQSFLTSALDSDECSVYRSSLPSRRGNRTLDTMNGCLPALFAVNKNLFSKSEIEPGLLGRVSRKRSYYTGYPDQPK